VIVADLPELDITDAAATASLVMGSGASVVVNCAAYTAVDDAETHPDIAFRVNRDGARNVAEGAARAKAAVVYLSTDYVFDGTKNGAYLESDAPNPLSVYGESKLAGELVVQRTLAEHFVVRTAWLFGLHGKSFPRTVLRMARSGQSLRVIDDQMGCPTYTEHLCAAIARIIERPLYGTYHAAGSGRCTWYQLAREVLRAVGHETEVTPIPTADYPLPAPRPRNSVLDTSKLAQCYGIRLPHWTEGVAAFCSQEIGLASNGR
jgi:dTDP-4-dehydrorhamnose reductase